MRAVCQCSKATAIIHASSTFPSRVRTSARSPPAAHARARGDSMHAFAVRSLATGRADASAPGKRPRGQRVHACARARRTAVAHHRPRTRRRVWQVAVWPQRSRACACALVRARAHRHAAARQRPRKRMRVWQVSAWPTCAHVRTRACPSYAHIRRIFA